MPPAAPFFTTNFTTASVRGTRLNVKWLVRPHASCKTQRLPHVYLMFMSYIAANAVIVLVIILRASLNSAMCLFIIEKRIPGGF